MTRRRTLAVAGAATVVALLAVVPRLVTAQDAEGFDGYIQSGTCGAPTDDLRVQLESEGDHDVEPYLAATGTGDETVVLGFYGSPGAPGFGFPVIYTDRPFSLVVSDADGDPVACGDILEPDADRFARAGLAVVQLVPVADSTVHGVALVDRGPLQRELVVTPTRVRILLSTGSEVGVPAVPAAGLDGYIQDGTCERPGDRLRVQLRSRGDADVVPFLAQPTDGGEPVTVAYHGTTGAPGFSVALASTDRDVSLVLTDADTGAAVACGDILAPDDDDVADAGVALVQLLPVGASAVEGFALLERTSLQRELDITPTRVRILVFAPPTTPT